MSWNYRIVKHDETDEVYFQIQEVYYDEKNDIEAYTEDPVHPFGETREEYIQKIDISKNTFPEAFIVLDSTVETGSIRVR